MEKVRPRQYYRHSLVLEMFNKTNNEKSIQIIDIGGGNNSFVKRLYKDGYKKVYVIDREKNIYNLQYYSKTFDAIFCLEVLEHVENDIIALQEMKRILKVTGNIYISIPINKYLWGKTDELVGHKRRYSYQSIKTKTTKAGLKIKEHHYWGYPINRIYMWLMNKYCELMNVKESETQELFVNKKVPKILHYVFYVDNIFNKFPYGIGMILKLGY